MTTTKSMTEIADVEDQDLEDQDQDQWEEALAWARQEVEQWDREVDVDVEE